MSTSTTDRPHTDDRTPSPPDVPRTTPPSKRLDLSLTQVVGGSLAAATAAALGSRLGVVGTISGAALVSVIASLASALYTASLRRTRDRVSSALGTVRGDRPVGDPTDRRQAAAHRPAPASDHRAPMRLSVRRMLAGATAVFVLAAAGVTGVELVTGRSFEGTSGTTVGSTLTGSTGGHSSTRQRTPQPTATPSASATPSTTPSATPSSSATTSATPSATPSSSATPTPTPTPSSTPTSSATTSSTPSATASVSPTPDSAVTEGGVLPGPDGR